MKRKLSSFFIAFLLTNFFVAAICENSNYSFFTSFAEKSVDEDGIVYVFDGGEAIVKTFETTSETVNIPETVNGFAVTQIDDDAFPFEGTASLSVKILNLPASLKVIPFGTFSNAATLEEINISDESTNFSSENGVLFDKPKNVIISYPARKKDRLFSLPETVNEIGNYAFQNTEFLSEIAFNSALKTIGHMSFYGSGLSGTVYIPANLETIGEFAFEKCLNIAEFSVAKESRHFGTLGGGIASSGITTDDKGLPKAELYETFGVLANKDGTELIQFPLASSAIRYEVPYSVRLIRGGAFAYSTELLDEVTIRETVKEIGAEAFKRTEGGWRVLIVRVVDGSYAQNYIAALSDPYVVGYQTISPRPDPMKWKLDHTIILLVIIGIFILVLIGWVVGKKTMEKSKDKATKKRADEIAELRKKEEKK